MPSGKLRTPWDFHTTVWWSLFCKDNRCYVSSTGAHTVGLLLFSVPGIGSPCFPWLQVWIWQLFFHVLSGRGTLTPVFLVTAWNSRKSERGNLSRERVLLVRLMFGMVADSIAWRDSNKAWCYDTWNSSKLLVLFLQNLFVFVYSMSCNQMLMHQVS